MMSQQGKEGFLDESELPEQIHRYLDLKLDKESFLRPTRDVVMELYTRFLDKTGYDWRRPGRHGKEPIVMAQMLNALKKIFSRYSIDYEFNLHDIVSPTRKRTTTFLNVILYLLAMLEEKLKNLQQWEAKNAVEQQEVNQINQEIAKKRVAIDELALQIGQYPDVEQLLLEIEARERVFDENKKECDRIEQEKCVIKKATEEECKKIERINREMQPIERHIELYNEVKRLEQEELQLKEKLAKDEIDDAKRLGLLDIEVSHAERDLHIKRNESMEFNRQAKARLKELETEIAGAIKQREDQETKHKQRQQEIKEQIERANKKLESLKSYYEGSRPADQSNIETLLSGFKEKLEILLGENKPFDKNSTFIKSRGPN